MSDDVQRTLGRLESKLDAVTDLLTSLQQRDDAMETRIRKVEKFHWKLLGGLGVVLSGFPLVLKFITK